MSDRADRVKRYLEDPIVKDAFENVRLRYLEMMEMAPVNSSQENVMLLLDCKKMLQALDDVKAALVAEIEAGVLEDFTNAEKEQPAFLGELNGRKAH